MYLMGSKAVLYPLLFQQFPVYCLDHPLFHFSTVNTLDMHGRVQVFVDLTCVRNRWSLGIICTIVSTLVYTLVGSVQVSARFNQAGDTHSEAAMSQLNFTQNNKHNSPEFYLGIARACPGLEPPMGGVKTGELVKVKMGSGEDRR